MKNIILMTTAVLLFTACNSNKKTNDSSKEISEEITLEMNETGLNTLVEDPEEEGSKMLLGEINSEGLENNTFPWFQENLKAYEIDLETVTALKTKLKDVTIKLFMGTWCEDSQREVPHLFKILRATGFNFDAMEIIAVSHDKDTPDGLEKGFDIEYVPTIIFLREGKELGRIVESTQESLEKDMIAILNGEGYKHIYAE